MEKESSDALLNSKSLVTATNDDILILYEEALRIGEAENDNQLTNTTTGSLCGIKYPRCPLDGNEIMYYVASIHDLDDLF